MHPELTTETEETQRLYSSAVILATAWAEVDSDLRSLNTESLDNLERVAFLRLDLQRFEVMCTLQQILEKLLTCLKSEVLRANTAELLSRVATTIDLWRGAAARTLGDS